MKTYPQRIMTVIPRTAVLSDSKPVGKAVSASNRALRDGNTVHVIRKQLTNTMPMDSCALVGKVVDDCDDDLISPAGL